jgi:hypothetical protein
MMTFSCRPTVLMLCCLLTLGACSPAYNWRQVTDARHTFSVLLPAKPAEFTRTIMLGDIQVDMTMTAAQVDQVQFAIGTFLLPNALPAPRALHLMAEGLRHNINGQAQPPLLTQALPANTIANDITYTGTYQGKTAHLFARLIAYNNRIYQILVLSTDGAIDEEQADILVASFKPVRQ